MVCGLVALIAGVLARSGAGDIEQARRQRAAADVQGLAQALATFEATVGQWPTLDAGAATNRTRVLLSGSVLPSANPWVGGHSFWAWVRSGFGDLMQNHLLVNAPGGQTAHRYPTQGAARWRGPYLDACPLDPWGRPYVANVLATYSTNRTNHRQLLVVSAGPDGRLQTAATATATQRIAGDDIGCLVWER
ncbi:MAG: type II secretion system protein GspG [Planctomycetota bacterium]